MPGALLVANHISWIDIYVIYALLPSAFVSKAEVRGWPLIGWLAARHGAIFLRRGSRGHARIIHAEIAEALARGQHVALFPEGTTSDSRSLLHFHAALLQPAPDHRPAGDDAGLRRRGRIAQAGRRRGASGYRASGWTSAGEQFT